MPEVNLDRFSCYYELTGNGLPLVFIHGAFIDTRIWDRQWQFFASKYQLLRYDLRGHGRSRSSSQADYSTDTYADDLAALLDALKISSPILCGLSMGGLVAQAFAVRYPERPKALVLVSASVSASLNPIEKVMRYILFPKWVMRLAIRSLGAKRFIRFSFRLARLIWGKNWLGKDIESQRYTEQCMLDMDPNEYLKVWESFYGVDILPLEEITCPTLVINGEYESKSIRAHSEVILCKVPHAVSQKVPDAYHASNWENPSVFNQILQEFIKNNS